MSRFLVWFGLWFCLGCERKIEVFCFPLDESGTSPTVTRLVGQTHTEAEPEPLSFALDAVNATLPASFTLIPPDRFNTQVIELDVQVFSGETLVYQASGSILPDQTELRLISSLCSNGSTEDLEACDDGGLIDGDGCDSTCRPTGCASGVATPGELCFSSSDDLIGPDGPLQVLAADFDGDELPDLAAPYRSLSSPGVVRVFPNTTQGSFGAFTEIPVPGVERVALGDLDGDGDLDIVASVDQPTAVPGLVILTNDGGAFSVGTETPLAALDVTALALGDIDGDGRLDLVFTDSGLLKVNLGESGGFGAQQQAVSLGAQAVALRLADIDADGDLDALTANTSGFVSVLKNGSSFFVESPLFTGGIPSALVLGEFDTSEGIDLAVAKQENGVGKIRLFTGSENGNFAGVADFDAPDSPSALVAADLDLDGDIDLATTSQTGSLIAVQFNNGGGQFDPPQDATGGLFDTRLGPVSLVAPDLNGDRVPDLVAAGKNLGLLLSNP